jgi:phosphinothricin acetyltransferase
MKECIFEEIREEHLPTVLEIYNYYILNSTATFHDHLLTIDEMREIVFFSNPRYKSFVINCNHEIYGYCILTQFKKREAYDVTAEVTVYLKHDCVGRGLGSLAVQHIETVARHNGIHSLLAVICGENTQSIRLFEKNGYNKCSHYREVGRKFGKLLDVVCYQKIL